MLGIFDRFRGRWNEIAFGGLTVGNLCAMMAHFDAEELDRVLEVLEADGWIEIFKINGVPHGRFKES